MEVGKKYRSGPFEYVCSAVTPGGGAIVYMENQTDVEYLIRKSELKQYKEVREKQKVYVFLVEIDGVNCSFSYYSKDTAEQVMGVFSQRKGIYKIVSDITEVEIEVK